MDLWDRKEVGEADQLAAVVIVQGRVDESLRGALKQLSSEFN